MFDLQSNKQKATNGHKNKKSFVEAVKKLEDKDVVVKLKPYYKKIGGYESDNTHSTAEVIVRGEYCYGKRKHKSTRIIFETTSSVRTDRVESKMLHAIRMKKIHPYGLYVLAVADNDKLCKKSYDDVRRECRNVEIVLEKINSGTTDSKIDVAIRETDVLAFMEHIKTGTGKDIDIRELAKEFVQNIT